MHIRRESVVRSLGFLTEHADTFTRPLDLRQCYVMRIGVGVAQSVDSDIALNHQTSYAGSRSFIPLNASNVAPS